MRESARSSKESKTSSSEKDIYHRCSCCSTQESMYFPKFVIDLATVKLFCDICHTFYINPGRQTEEGRQDRDKITSDTFKESIT